MSKHAQFFQTDRQAAAVLKHGVLDRYLATFAGKVGSTSVNNRVGYVDGFAGSGVYVNPITGRRTPGSPAIALTIASSLRRRSRILESTFIEMRAKEFASLGAVVESYADSGAQVFRGDVRTHLPGALDRFADVPLLVFLDPFGTSLETDAVVKILRRPLALPTEVLLNFSIDSVRRIGGRLFERAKAPGREASLRRLDTWLGGDWWRPYFVDPGLNGVENRFSISADRVFAEYVRRVNSLSGSSSFTVPIRRQPHHLPIFYLTLFFRRSFAVMPFNEAVSMATQDWRMHLQDLDLTEADLLDYRNPPLPGLSRVGELRQVFADDEVAFKAGTIDTIAETIRESLSARSALSVTNDFTNVFGPAVGTGRTLHLRAAWKSLAKEGLVRDPPTGNLDFAMIHKRVVPRFG
ncbi:three-Cys-motif partner protein TcmP [soil metagenome]